MKSAIRFAIALIALALVGCMRAQSAQLLATGISTSDATVTYENPGSRVEVVLPELSKLTGLKLSAAKDVAGIPLILRLHDALVEVALAKIAYVVRGVWSIKNGVRELRLDSAAISKLKADAVAERKGVLKGLRGDLGSGEVPRSMIHNWAPAYAAVGKLIPYVDKGLISGLRLNQSVVYSDHPRPLQHRLPPLTNNIVSTMIHDLNVMPPAGENYAVSTTFPTKGKIVGPPYKTNLIIAPGAFSQYEYLGLAVSVNVYDRSGHLITAQQVVREHETPVGPEPQRIGANEPEVGKPLPIDPFYLAVVDYTINNGKSTRAIVNFVSQPLKHDPIEAQGATLVAYAKLHDLQLVASLADFSSLQWAKYGLVYPTGSSVIQAILDRLGGRPSGGWSVTRRPITTATSRWFDTGEVMDRHKLQRLVDAVPRLEVGDFDAKILGTRLGVYELGLGSSGPLPQYYLLNHAHDGRSGRVWQALALLTDQELKALKLGRQVPLADTPQEFKKDFLMRVQGFSYAIPRLQHDPPPNAKSLHWVGPGPDDLQSEYTEVASEAIPADGYLKLVPTDEGYEFRWYISPHVYFSGSVEISEPGYPSRT